MLHFLPTLVYLTASIGFCLLAFLDLLLVSFLVHGVHGVLAVVCCLFHSMQILLTSPNDLQRQLRGGVEV